MVNISDDFYQLAVAVTGLASRPGRMIGKRYAFQTLPIVESKSTSLILGTLGVVEPCHDRRETIEDTADLLYTTTTTVRGELLGANFWGSMTP